eukprot:TRINITY_DN15628_c0_g1_i1.p1 TRINITY_DN15628_c0_g1~~TRINITY_DN15628_c0_g1_i1.p1  ORF type:complete len:893 (-),score=185.87 TRINITY_DN15628_c0_g1_i1:37-2541(-)
MEHRPELDRYSSDMLDEEDYGDMPLNQRRLAEKAMQTWDKQNNRQTRGRDLLSSDDDEEEVEEVHVRKKRRKAETLDEDDLFLSEEEEFEDDDEEPIAIEGRQSSLKEWLILDSTRRAVEKRFRKFLREFVDRDGSNKYLERITAMCSSNKESLEIDFADIFSTIPLFAEWLADAPGEVIPLLDEIAFREVTNNHAFPDYGRIHPEIHVRITGLPLAELIRDLRNEHLNALIKVKGVVTRRTSVYPQIRHASYNCSHCSFLHGPFFQDDSPKEAKPAVCASCHGRGPFTLNAEHSHYRNFQKVTLQESPGSVPAGRLPRSKDVILLHDLIDTVKPGDEIEVTGIYKTSFDRQLNTQQGFPVFKTVIEANYVLKPQDAYESFRLTDADERTIRNMSKDQFIGEKLIQSIAPSIYGHTDIKTAIALSLFGGQAKMTAQGHRIRGDINVLLLGDPGTAKSQFLKYVEKTAYRAVYTTGKGASAVGLTASVHKDPLTHEWTLEGGALVLADKGVCMIDEFDKMSDQDRTSIHEAMEQQSISISKAGIVTSLQARCSVIAAANPVRGRYETSLSFIQNVDLSEAILSRFDILCVVRDTADPEIDGKLAKFVVASHVRSHPEKRRKRAEEAEAMDEEKDEGDEGLEQDKEKAMTEGHIPQDLLKKYITYARDRIHPKLNRMNSDKLVSLFAELRKETRTGGMPMTVRHLESMIRLSEAHAKMHLREYVNEDDINMAIRVTLNTFISSQKFSIAQQLQKTFSKYITLKKDDNEMLMYILRMVVREYIQAEPDKDIEIDLEELEGRAREYQITSVRPFFRSKVFEDSHFRFDERRKVITYNG